MSDAQMTLREAAMLTRAHLERSFPRPCSSCGREFGSLADYLRGTTHLDAPVSFDDEHGEIPASPLGTMSLANCACGTTLALGTDGMSNEEIARLMRWARAEVARRGVSRRAVLIALRDEIDRMALAEPP